VEFFHKQHKEDQKAVFQILAKFVYGTNPKLLRGRDKEKHVEDMTEKYPNKLAHFLWFLCDKIPLRGSQVKHLVRDCFKELNDYPRCIIWGSFSIILWILLL
jgi:hypothetical protein